MGVAMPVLAAQLANVVPKYFARFLDRLAIRRYLLPLVSITSIRKP